MIRRIILCGAAALIAACGGGSGSASNPVTPPVTPPVTSNNVVAVVVDAGPNGNSVNTLFTTITVCVPGSTTACQTIDHIQIDTGSYGLRLLAPALNLTLPVLTAGSGDALLECVNFVDGYTWGPVAAVDLTIGGESASNVAVQVIGDPRYPNVPANCSTDFTTGKSGTEEDTVATFGANGILGIGAFIQDCGPGCVNPVLPTTTMNYPYFSCSATACVQTAVPLSAQVQNPVALFPVDNNGTIIELPAVAASGAVTLTGSLIFGVGTQSNNSSNATATLTLNPDTGDFTTNYKGNQLDSFLDTGSNGIYFMDSTIPSCTQTGLADFYCPTSTLNLSATLIGENNAQFAQAFVVANTQTLLAANPTYNVEPALAGSTPPTLNAPNGSFDWGLAFYYGKRVTTVTEGVTTSAASGPYVAF